MDRRRFLRNLAATTAAVEYLPLLDAEAAEESDTEGHTLVCEFQIASVGWKVYEDLRVRDGTITLVSAGGKRVLAKSAEPTFTEANPPYLGLSLNDIGMAGADLLADKLLERGDPDPEIVRSAAPPLGSAAGGNPGARLPWNAIVGTKECSDTMPVFPGGNTRTYHPAQYFPELRAPGFAQKRYEGLLGGWMPAVRKVFPLTDGAYCEAIVFGDVEARDKFIVQTWHRTARIENGKIIKVVYGHSYPAFPPARTDPKAEEFYRALLAFAGYWDRQLRDFAAASTPHNVWIDMAKHAFAKELMVRPGGVYPKYGAVDRDYYGSEYDGFQDVFTSAIYTNLEWGRFEPARLIIDNYFSDFVDSKGMVNMRGPETAQFGMTLSLLARYFEYTRDGALLAKHRAKIEATAALLAAMHDQSLRLPRDNPGYGLIHGWSESDACLALEPGTWWKPYFANSAFAARGLMDIGRVWPEIPGGGKSGPEWLRRARVLQDATVASMEKNVRRDMNPPYIGPLPGTKLTFRESMEQERPSPQQWPHRPYAELLQADVLPANLANTVIDCMRAYGATTLGVVANVGRARPGGRAILGFISYGYAQMLLRLDRVEEYLLFLYSHRYHDHTPGSWTAGEVAGITGGTALFCIPAQQTIPLLVRWMLVLDDSDEERLYFGKGLPREWVASGKPIKIEQAPTRWGRVNFELVAKPATKSVVATVELARAGSPRELHVKLRMPVQQKVRSVTVNGRVAALGGLHGDTVVIATGREMRFEVVGRFGG
ncbi:MAG TPA: hypothetical protein VEU96_09850 [Bryobacteraceae bacterium]|nr:hypothetical protein [Bryobacteraceae bacterium]